MTSTAPSPQTWTLRLKHGKTTILLHADPLQTFTSLKETLHTALQETTLTNPDTGAAIPLPPSPTAYQLGVPVNPAEPNRGFQLGVWEISEDDDDNADGAKGKGKGKANGGSRKVEVGPGSVKNCPKGAGLRDGAVLAVRWRGDGAGWEDEESEDELEGLRVKKGDMWGVRLASFEDGYGVENEGDLGGGVRTDGD